MKTNPGPGDPFQSIYRGSRGYRGYLRRCVGLYPRHLRLKFLWFLLGAMAFARDHIPLVVPFQKFSQTLIASADLTDKSYIVVPVTLSVAPDEMLIGMKRGDAHARDREAVFEINAYQPSTGRMRGRRASIGEPGLTYYNGEFVRHANGAIDCFVDVQQGGAVERLGLRAARSTDGGKTFSAPHRVGPIDGVEYGYVFESVVRAGRTFMLAMRFANLAGGRSLHPRWPHAGSVDVLASDDHGATWRFVRDLTTEFGGIPINESSLLPWGDGWLLACRGYDNRQWLVRTDAAFRSLVRRDLTADFDCVNSLVGRPRLYERDGRHYMLGRNWTQPLAVGARSPMQLCWFRFSPETLALETCVILDNAERNNVVDGYYATAHWREREGVTLLNILTYKRADFVSEQRLKSFHNPDLIRLEFVWDEIK
ncbi:MAG: exo-alpha-sialidase [Opitutus sp.]|nr:exo-alpha-sialidase [Opitutus sp.]